MSAIKNADCTTGEADVRFNDFEGGVKCWSVDWCAAGLLSLDVTARSIETIQLNVPTLRLKQCIAFASEKGGEDLITKSLREN